MDNRPQGRQKNVTGQGKSVSRRGSGLGTGPVGSSNGYAGRGNGGSSGRGGSGPNRSSGSSGGGGLIKIIAILVLLFGGGSFGLNSLTGSGSDTGAVSTPAVVQTAAPAETARPTGYYDSLFEALFGSSYSSDYGGQSASNMTEGFSYSDLFGGTASSVTANGSSVTTASANSWQRNSNNGKLNTTVAAGTRDRYTTIKGNGKDTVTIMVYMCGTDLESKSGMGTRDLQEMLAATLSDKVNLIVFTGGCSQWRNNIISSSVNQIYKLENGGLKCLNSNAGTASMTNPSTLSGFITYCAKNYPANRNMLILWDHGGGSISGYGYDEKNSRTGSMSLSGINQALGTAKVRFDAIGFDACLMATLETGLTLAPYADYLIASEETEPGLGWYYTNWLTALSKNTSMSTLELGKQICDDFVDTCARQTSGQKTTLSVIDLAELQATVPESFNSFSASTLELLNNDGYKTVATARSSTREFATSTKIDQIDLVHFALNLNTDAGRAFADVLLSAVKYNRVSASMTNAYGISMYFPYQKPSQVKTAVSAYDAIGLDDTYTNCIRTFATLQASGQTAAGYSSYSGSGSYSGSSYGNSGYYSSNAGAVPSLNGSSSGSGMVSGDLLSSILSQMLGGSSGSYYDRSIDVNQTAAYIESNRFDANSLLWAQKDGVTVLTLSEEQWSLITDLELNLFVDDGEGYIDLGLDNVFDFTVGGDLVGQFDGTWLAIDSQPVAYYHTDTTVTEDGYTITGRVPVLLNGSRADLIIVFSSECPYGYIAGARTDYRGGETETIAKGMTELQPGDTIDFLCDYYTYDGTYSDTYFLGEQVTYTGDELISNVYLSEEGIATYRFTDIYGASYWTPAIP